MKINRPEGRVVVLFRDIGDGSLFELNGRLYIKSAIGILHANAILLQECGCDLEYIPAETRCILVDVEISYTYISTEKDERND